MHRTAKPSGDGRTCRTRGAMQVMVALVGLLACATAQADSPIFRESFDQQIAFGNGNFTAFNGTGNNSAASSNDWHGAVSNAAVNVDSNNAQNNPRLYIAEIGSNPLGLGQFLACVNHTLWAAWSADVAPVAMPAEMVGEITVNNNDTTAALRLIARVGGQWYATAQEFKLTTAGVSVTDWSKSVRALFHVTTAKEEWLELTLTVGTSLALGGTPAADLSGTIDALGLYGSSTLANSIWRMNDFAVWKAEDFPGVVKDITTTTSGSLRNLASVTFDQDGNGTDELSLTPSELVGATLAYCSLTNTTIILFIDSNRDPAPRASVIQDAALNTGILNVPKGDGLTGPYSSTSRGIAVTFAEPIRNGLGVDVVLIDYVGIALQALYSMDPFHVSLLDGSARRPVVFPEFTRNLGTTTWGTLNWATKDTDADDWISLAELEAASGTRTYQGQSPNPFYVSVTGIDLASLGVAKDATVTGLFLQTHNSTTMNGFDPLYIGGVYTALPTGTVISIR